MQTTQMRTKGQQGHSSHSKEGRMRLSVLKRGMAVITATATLAFAGMAGQVQAFTFSNGDLVLGIYGNSTEAVYDLGNANTILSSSPIVNQNVSAGLAAVQAAGAGTVKYTLFQFDDSFSTGGGVI